MGGGSAGIVTLRDKSDESLTVARWCRNNSHYNRAVSSAYYAAYQALHHELDEVGAPIDPEGVTSGARWEHGTLPRGAVEFLGLPFEMAARLTDAYDLRVAADYYEIAMTQVRADTLIAFAEEVREWIRKSKAG